MSTAQVLLHGDDDATVPVGPAAQGVGILRGVLAGSLGHRALGFCHRS